MEICDTKDTHTFENLPESLEPTSRCLDIFWVYDITTILRRNFKFYTNYMYDHG